MQDRYIGKQAALNLKSYAYKSTNASLVYHYFTSPLTQFLVDRMPRNISPNSMSVTGFFCVLTFYCITMGFYYNDTVPTWLMILSSCLIFCYSIIDNMDGKQARRTGASSPLGLIMDHQVDSFVTVMIAAFMTKLFSFHLTDCSMILWFAMCTPFYLATWEEYQLGQFNLGVFNGADEGCMIGVFLVLSAGVLGLDTWTSARTIFAGFSAIEVVFTLIVLGGIATSAENLNSVRSKPNKGDIWDSTKGYVRLFIAWILVRLFSPANIAIENHLALGAFYACLYSKDTALLQLAHVTDGLFQGSKVNDRLVDALVLYSICAYIGLNPISEANFLYILAFLSLINYAYTAVFGALEIATILEIPIFAMPKPK